MIAALYVESRGVYAGLPDVDLWDRDRDALTYARTLASGCAPAMRQMGTVLGRQPDPAAAARRGRRRGMLRRGPGRDATARRCLGAPRGQPCVDRTSDSSRYREPAGGRDGLAGGVDVLRGKRTLRAPLPQDHMVVRSGRRVAWLRRGKSAAASKIEDGDHSAAERWRAIKMEACQRLSHRERKRHTGTIPRSPDRNGRHSQDEE